VPDISEKIKRLKCWSGDVQLSKLEGGITNENYLAEDLNGKFVVRVGDDIPLHQIMRFNELAASRAAFLAGLSPEVHFAVTGILIIRFIEGKTLTEEDVQSDDMLARILPVLKKCHCDIPKYLKGPVLTFWVFHVLNDYSSTLLSENGPNASLLPELMEKASVLEDAIGPIDLVFGHNDLLAANLIDDGRKIWIIDWDYAGFNSPLFDLGGLTSNNALSTAQENWMLETYFERPVTDLLWRQYSAMKCASLLRETLWSMVSETHSVLDFDYQSYTNSNLQSFQSAYTDFLNL